MKNRILIILVVVMVIAIGYLFFKTEEWQRKIDRHTFVADSLGRVVEKMDKKVFAKDSMLLAYMQTLNKSLYELDKEASKDKATLNQNEQRQAEILKAFCEKMVDLNNPDFCR